MAYNTNLIYFIAISFIKIFRLVSIGCLINFNIIK